MASSTERGARSFLFAPGDNERIVSKALASTADVVVIDLEDAITENARGEALGLLRQLTEPIAERPTHVRVGRAEHGYDLEEVELAVEVGATAIRLPKATNPAHIEDVSRSLDRVDPQQRVALYLTIEGAAGLLALHGLIIASDRVRAAVFGERDFLADLGVDHPGVLTDHARSTIALVSRSAGIDPPIDGAYIDIDDDSGLAAACRRARELGFTGKSAIHPRQLATIHSVFTPSAEEIEAARETLTAFQTARELGLGVTTLDGRLVDAATARRAERVIASAHRGEQS